MGILWHERLAIYKNIRIAAAHLFAEDGRLNDRRKLRFPNQSLSCDLRSYAWRQVNPLLQAGELREWLHLGAQPQGLARDQLRRGWLHRNNVHRILNPTCTNHDGEVMIHIIQQ